MLNKELKDSQMLLEMHKKMSLAKSIELEDSKKQIILLKKKLELSLPDEEDMEMKTDYQKTQEIEMLEQEELKLVDYDIPKSDISDKALILQEEAELFQKIDISNNEMLEESEGTSEYTGRGV